MTWHPYLPYTAALFFTVILCLITAVFVWRHRHVQGGWLLLAFMVAVSYWDFVFCLEGAVVEMGWKVRFTQIGYIGYLVTVPLVLSFVLVYTGQVRQDNKKLFTLFILPLISWLMVLTNDWHHWVYSGFKPGLAEYNLIIYQHGPYFWVYTIYNYLILAALLLVLIREFIWASRPYRWQLAILILGGMLPGLGGLVYLSSWNPIPGMDWTGVFTAFSGVLFTFGTFRRQILTLVPIARDFLIENLKDGVVVISNEGQVLDHNPAASALLTQKESFVGKPIKDIFPSGALPLPDEPEKSIIEIGISPGKTSYIELTSSDLYLRAGKPTGKLIVLHDITQSHLTEMELHRITQNLQVQINEIVTIKDQAQEQALRDSLTALYNRRFLFQALDTLINLAETNHFPISFLMADLDHFKETNDLYGHDFGDEALCAFADMLLSQTRSDDIVCRYGGEEFMIILPKVSLQNGVDRANKICSQSHKLTLSRPVTITTSIGVSVFPENGSTPEELIKAADHALYNAKARGRDQVVF